MAPAGRNLGNPSGKAPGPNLIVLTENEVASADGPKFMAASRLVATTAAIAALNPPIAIAVFCWSRYTGRQEAGVREGNHEPQEVRARAAGAIGG
jgi:hypothetical protein